MHLLAKVKGDLTVKIKYLVAALCMVSSVANAKFVETDWLADGDALATLDTESGLEWLDLSETVNHSISSVDAQTGVGGLYEGWRLPTYDEIQFLMQEGLFEGLFVTSGMQQSSANQTAVSEFYRLHGYTRDDSNPRSYGMYVHDNGEVRMFGAAEDDIIAINHDHAVYPNAGPYNYAHPLHGVWLVSDGGVTLSSSNNARINDPVYWENGGTLDATNVSVTSLGVLSISSLLLLGLRGARRKTRS